MLSILTESQRAIVETVTMRLHVIQALKYLEDTGHEMSRATYFRQKKKIENMALERMHHIAKVAYKEQHLERLDRLELAEKLMWDNYFIEKDPSKKVKILESIITIQPYVSGYYDSTRYVLEETVKADEDLHRNKRAYVGIDVEELRKKEFEQESEERRLKLIKERQAAALNEPANPLPAIEGTEEEVKAELERQRIEFRKSLDNNDNSVNFVTVQEEIESKAWVNADTDANNTIEKKQTIEVSEPEPGEDDKEEEEEDEQERPEPLSRP